MTKAIEDVSSLPGKKVSDQEEVPIGEVQEIYAVDGDGEPMWVTIEVKSGVAEKRTVLVPLARLKEEHGELRVPYSADHIKNTPEIENADEISDDEDRQLRDHYGIDRADQEMRSDNDSYATRVTEQEGTVKRVEDPDSLETPDASKITDETRSRLEDAGPSETRDVDAGKIADQNASNSAGGDGAENEHEGRSEDRQKSSAGDAETEKRQEE